MFIFIARGCVVLNIQAILIIRAVRLFLSKSNKILRTAGLNEFSSLEKLHIGSGMV